MGEPRPSPVRYPLAWNTPTLPFKRPQAETPTAVLEGPAWWQREITQKFFPTARGTARVPERPQRVPSSQELLKSGLDGAIDADLFLQDEKSDAGRLTERLREEQSTKPSLTAIDFMRFIGGHFVRLGMPIDEGQEYLRNLSENPAHIRLFYDAFSGARTVIEAYKYLTYFPENHR